MDAMIKAEAVLKLLEDLAASSTPPVILPLSHRISIADQQVIPCAEVRVGVVGASLQTTPLNPLACDVIPLYTLAVTIARDCAITYNDDGSEDDASLNALNHVVERDWELLTYLFEELGGNPVIQPAAALTTRQGTVGTTVTGAMAYTTLTCTLD